MIYIESHSLNPYWNLALEQYVFDEMPKTDEYFLLWQNESTVVIGKHQNAMAEINFEYVKSHNIKVARRLSGGGAVYHDHGNLNYTFIMDAANQEEIDFSSLSVPLVNTLSKIGVPAALSGRNDVLVDGMKCCGNSQYVKNKRVMQHGCILFDADMTKLSKALNSRPEKYKYKGTASVRSRVTNIRPYLKKDMDVLEFREILKNNMFDSVEITEYKLNDNDIKRIDEIMRSLYETWDWNFGHSPEYSVIKKNYFENVGFIELFLDVDNNGIIRNFESKGDYFSFNNDFSILEKAIIGCRMNEDDILDALSNIDISTFYSNLTNEDFIKLFFSE